MKKVQRRENEHRPHDHAEDESKHPCVRIHVVSTILAPHRHGPPLIPAALAGPHPAYLPGCIPRPDPNPPSCRDRSEIPPGWRIPVRPIPPAWPLFSRAHTDGQSLSPPFPDKSRFRVDKNLPVLLFSLRADGEDVSPSSSFANIAYGSL